MTPLEEARCHLVLHSVSASVLPNGKAIGKDTDIHQVGVSRALSALREQGLTDYIQTQHSKLNFATKAGILAARQLTPETLEAARRLNAEALEKADDTQLPLFSPVDEEFLAEVDAFLDEAPVEQEAPVFVPRPRDNEVRRPNWQPVAFPQSFASLGGFAAIMVAATILVLSL